MTERDWHFLDWLQRVRLCTMRDAQTILGVLGGKPISLHTTQIRVRKLVELGKINRMRPALHQESILWVSREHSGVAEPRPIGALSRHMLGVAAVSAHLVAQGWSFDADRQRNARGEKLAGIHEGDGLITNQQGQSVLIEVELSRKNPVRYSQIANAQTERFANTQAPIAGVWYYVSREARSAVEEMISAKVPEQLRGHYRVLDAFDGRHEFMLPREPEGATAFVPVGYEGLTNRWVGIDLEGGR